MKKYSILFLGLVISVFSMHAQVLKPVKWTFSSESLGKNEHNLVFTATIDPTWWTYSQFIKEGGPIPTSFKFNENKNIVLEGTVSESGDHVKEGIEPMFDMFLKKYADKVVFKQKIKVISGKPEITGTVEFMCCDDKQCLAPMDIDFKISL